MGAADQGLVFAVVGFAAGIVGTATSNGLLAVRKALDKNFESQNEAPNVLLNAGTWATHMGVSSNVRYQILNGIDMVRAQITLSFKVLFSSVCFWVFTWVCFAPVYMS